MDVTSRGCKQPQDVSKAQSFLQVFRMCKQFINTHWNFWCEDYRLRAGHVTWRHSMTPSWQPAAQVGAGGSQVWGGSTEIRRITFSRWQTWGNHKCWSRHLRSVPVTQTQVTINPRFTGLSWQPQRCRWMSHSGLSTQTDESVRLQHFAVVYAEDE